MTKSIIIKVPETFTDENFSKMAKTWDTAKDVGYEMPEFSSNENLRQFSWKVIDKLPNSFASTLASEIAEMDDKIDEDVLLEIFDKGDTGCRVSVCLRDDLTDRLKERCRFTRDENVRDHLVAKALYRNSSKKN